MRACQISVIIFLFGIAACVFAEPSIQMLDNPNSPLSCKQAMVSNNSNHEYFVEINYVYTGYVKNSDGTYSNGQFASFWNFYSYPGTSYHSLGSFNMACERGPALNYNVKFTDITAQREAAAADQERARQEMQRRADESVRRQQEEQRNREQARIDEENRRKQAAADAAATAAEAAAERQRQIDAYQQAEREATQERIRQYREKSKEWGCNPIYEADIAHCEQAKQRFLEAKSQEAAKQREAAERKRREQQEKESAELRQREEQERAVWMRNNPCEAASSSATQLQQLNQNLARLKGSKSTPTQSIEHTRQQISQVSQQKAALDQACSAKNPKMPTAQQIAEKQRIEADRQRSIENSRQWEREEKSNTQKMKNDNDELQRMLNNMR